MLLRYNKCYGMHTFLNGITNKSYQLSDKRANLIWLLFGAISQLITYRILLLFRVNQLYHINKPPAASIGPSLIFTPSFNLMTTTQVMVAQRWSLKQGNPFRQVLTFITAHQECALNV